MIFRRNRFGDLVRRQLDLFEEDEADLLQEAETADRAYDEAEREDAEEAYGDSSSCSSRSSRGWKSCGTPTVRPSTTTRERPTSRRSAAPRRKRFPTLTAAL